MYATPLITDLYSDGRKDVIVPSFVHYLEVRHAHFRQPVAFSLVISSDYRCIWSCMCEACGLSTGSSTHTYFPRALLQHVHILPQSVASVKSHTLQLALACMHTSNA